jgi:N-acetylglucosaminyldiphosphoundecaprenol N-acetyl-beta-D-mannosaminyltransferase
MMQRKKIEIFSIPVDALTMQQTLEYIGDCIRHKRQIHHTVVNAGKIVMMQDDPQLFESVVKADLINADGQGVIWAARLLGKKLPERVTGIDLMDNLVKFAHENKYKIFLLGAKEEVVRTVAGTYSRKYSPDIIAGFRNGYYRPEEEEEIAEVIAKSGAQILFVAISSPKKENFLFHNKHILKDINFIMGVGGSFDIVANITDRAPGWMQRIGLEWLFRLLQEPRRMWRRYTIGNIRFILLILKELLKKKPIS